MTSEERERLIWVWFACNDNKYADAFKAEIAALRAEIDRLKVKSCDDGCRIQRMFREFVASSEPKSRRVHQTETGDGS